MHYSGPIINYLNLTQFLCCLASRDDHYDNRAVNLYSSSFFLDGQFYQMLKFSEQQFTRSYQLWEVTPKVNFVGNRFVLLVWFGFFVLWHNNICELFNAKAILVEEQ